MFQELSIFSIIIYLGVWCLGGSLGVPRLPSETVSWLALGVDEEGPPGVAERLTEGTAPL